jgi:alpha-1,3-rhamnosyl/mannosyltransferase
MLQKTETYEDTRLVLIGKSFLNGTLVETQKIKHEINELHLEHSVIFPGHVSDEELAGMYTGALCCVQPSLYEGFGFPVLEAMACGCPVVCSRSSSLPEIAGPSIRIEPTSVDSMVTGIKTCVGLPEKERNTLISEGMAWTAKFTWKKVAHETVQAYERIRI